MEEIIKETFKAAEAGDAKIQFRLGLSFSFGFNVTKDYEKAVYWFKKAAEGGEDAAKYELAKLCYEKKLVKYEKEAFGWLCQIAEEEYPGAQHLLGLYYETGFGTPKNHEEAQKWFELADGNGYEEMNPEISDEQLVKMLKEQVDQGDVEALFRLGRCYFVGLGVSEDKEKAVELYFKAAEKGHASAMFELACCYADGKGGLKESKKESAKWLEKSAEKGHAEAQFYLGLYHECGFGMQNDIKEAIKCYEESAENGCKEAQYHLGNFYYEGRAVRKSFKKAFELLEKAAKQNHPEASFYVGRLL